MKKEELLNIEFENKKELILSLCEFFDFELANDEEKKNWPYKGELFISIKNLNGKELYNNKKLIGIIDECYFGKTYRGRDAVMIKCKEKEYSLTDSQIKIYNKFSKKKELVDLHPSRKGIKFWSYGHILSEKDYKSLYYKTKEYRDEYEKSLNENLGTNGIKSPIQCPKIKKKISKTIEEKYGVNWFLERGLHYSAVTITMEERFGVDNLFNSYDWQIENIKKINANFNQTSKIENEICYELDLIFGSKNSFHNNSSKGQKIIVVNKNTFYKLDYYHEEYNLTVEVLGDYWHCNPKIYGHDFYNKNKKKLAVEIWDGDRKRKNEIINSLNCVFLDIWEKDWKENKKNILQYIKSLKK